KAECKNGHYSGRLQPGAWSGASLALEADGATADLRGFEAVEYTVKSNTKFDLALGQPDIKDGDNAAFTLNEPGSEWKSYRHLLKDGKQQGWGERHAV